jgi:hypothetical protein
MKISLQSVTEVYGHTHIHTRNTISETLMRSLTNTLIRILTLTHTHAHTSYGHPSRENHRPKYEMMSL